MLKISDNALQAGKGLGSQYSLVQSQAVLRFMFTAASPLTDFLAVKQQADLTILPFSNRSQSIHFLHFWSPLCAIPWWKAGTPAARHSYNWVLSYSEKAMVSNFVSPAATSLQGLWLHLVQLTVWSSFLSTCQLVAFSPFKHEQQSH